MSRKVRSLARLVRLPAALTVLGDTLTGAAAAGRLREPRAWALPLSSVCLYWAGMALNDYADRALDAVERPERPLPSGEVGPGEALAVASGLTVAGVGVAALAGGRRSALVASALAATVWTYDLVLKPTRLSPLGMATARGLDVLLGAGDHPGRAARPALAMAVHTLGVTALSRGEVHGTRPEVAAGSLACTLAGATLAAGPDQEASTTGRVTVGGVLAGAFAGTYAATVGTAQGRALSEPSAEHAREATGVGIRGMIPLQAALLSRYGAPELACALAVGAPVAARASKRVAVT
ncbi:SCO3242 family prenyltransferase [Nocardiopsis sp. MG754419]|uniref:SCO3242 family prenyltransferase n=1 Tax=Nocardiopsis sp. MG754419 TaxID=2259865 RepID=UPI001BA6699B|nr:UbiA family prenyltransferase [Nocardiopsis sp. MG754419]MBR8740971.1 4-hydroxybenzoate polyprenyltransferase [Nocardiopsis sp. MG754419]